MPGGDAQFDVFISYKSEYKPWVEALARNLKQQRFEVWLDDWRRIPGSLIPGTLDSAINNSKVSIRFQGRPLFASNLDPSWMKELAYPGSA
jgi:hypothetical protein